MPVDPNAKLTKATIDFITHDDNKDWNTHVEVFLRNRISFFFSQDLAKLANFADNTEFVDTSTHPFDLVVESDNILLKDITLPTIQIDITPKGNDRWIFDYIVSLTFSDGTTVSSNKSGIILDQDNRTFEGVLS